MVLCQYLAEIPLAERSVQNALCLSLTCRSRVHRSIRYCEGMAAASLLTAGTIGVAVEPRIVIAGAGLHGSALAYYLTQRGETPLVVEQHSVAAAASGKGGGFLARDWGSGPTTALHKVSFELHAQIAKDLNIESYRKIPVLSVTPGKRSKRTNDLCPWLDGELADSRWMDKDGGAQVAPYGKHPRSGPTAGSPRSAFLSTTLRSDSFS